MVVNTLIKKGYKQTEIGIIPEDWSVKELGVCLQKHPRYGIGAAAVSYSEILPKYLRITDISDNGMYLPEKMVSVDHPLSGNYFLNERDLVVARTGASVGKSYLYKTKDGPLVFAGFLICLSPNPEILNSEYLNNYLRTKKYWNWVKTTSMRSGQPGINGKEYSQLQIPVPSIKEQIAIATFLSDTDTLINQLVKLIIKKKAIKQGTMQQLLTGKKRLPGFTGEWKEKKLEEIGKTYGGLSGKTKSDFNNGKFPYIPFMNIMSNPVINSEYLDYVNIKSEERQNKVSKGDLFFNGSSETPEEVGMCSVIQNDIPNLYLNSFCFGFRLNNEIKTDGLYLSYFFRSPTGRDLIFSLAQGATRYNLSKTNFVKLKIPYPDPEEQTVIANLLSDMDKEIELLEHKRDKYIMLKNGMMQQLLTGTIRIYGNK